MARAGASVILNYLKRETKAKAVESEIAGLGRACIAVQADVSRAAMSNGWCGRPRSGSGRSTSWSTTPELRACSPSKRSRSAIGTI
ncbi:MAG: hypothetical protein WDO73_33240 [Ignavibacteriota bacterium]